MQDTGHELWRLRTCSKHQNIKTTNQRLGHDRKKERIANNRKRVNFTTLNVGEKVIWVRMPRCLRSRTPRHWESEPPKNRNQQAYSAYSMQVMQVQLQDHEDHPLPKTKNRTAGTDRRSEKREHGNSFSRRWTLSSWSQPREETWSPQ